MKKEFNLRKISELDHIIRIEQVKKWKQATERSQWYMIKDWNQIVCLWFLTVCSLADSVRLRSCKRIRLSSRWELSLKAEWNGQASSFMTFLLSPFAKVWAVWHTSAIDYKALIFNKPNLTLAKDMMKDYNKKYTWF